MESQMKEFEMNIETNPDDGHMEFYGKKSLS